MLTVDGGGDMTMREWRGDDGEYGTEGGVVIGWRGDIIWRL